MKKSLKSEQEIVRRLVGAWTLITWVEIQANGKQVYHLGKGAVGQLLYDANGHVAAQLVRRRRKRFRSEDWKDASETESARAWKEYFGYFGTYSIDLRQRTVIHHVEGGWFPNLLHSDQVRHFRFEGSKLILDANTKWGRVRIVWKRSTGRASKTAKNQEAYGGPVRERTTKVGDQTTSGVNEATKKGSSD